MINVENELVAERKFRDNSLNIQKKQIEKIRAKDASERSRRMVSLWRRVQPVPEVGVGAGTGAALVSNGHSGESRGKWCLQVGCLPPVRFPSSLDPQQARRDMNMDFPLMGRDAGRSKNTGPQQGPTISPPAGPTLAAPAYSGSPNWSGRVGFSFSERGPDLELSQLSPTPG